MLLFINLVCIVVSILFIWNKTDAFISYCELLGWFKTTINNYNLTSNLSFPQFLYVTYKHSMKNKLTLFSLKLITCPICLGLWLSSILCLLTGVFAYTLIVFILSVILYSILERLYS